jgi:hypothetical protein
MRFVVLILGLLGCFATATMGALLLFPPETRPLLEGVIGPEAMQFILNTRDENSPVVGLFLLIGAAMGLFGTLLGFFRCGPQGAALLVVGVIGPAILSPTSLMFVGLQPLVGILSIFVRRLPASA